MQAFLDQYGIWAGAALLFFGELGLPTIIPVEIALLLVGSGSIQSTRELLWSLPIVIAADMAGTTILHWVARTGGVGMLRRLHLYKPESPGKVSTWTERLRGHDAGMVFVLRLVPLVRMYTAVGTGIIGIPFRRYLMGALPASVIWAGAPLAAGYYFRDSINSIVHAATRASHTVTALVVVVVVVLIAFHWVGQAASRGQAVRRAYMSAAALAIVALGLVAVFGGWGLLVTLVGAGEMLYFSAV